MVTSKDLSHTQYHIKWFFMMKAKGPLLPLMPKGPGKNTAIPSHPHLYHTRTLFHHPLPFPRGLAHSENFTDEDDTECDSVLGLVPHQV